MCIYWLPIGVSHGKGVSISNPNFVLADYQIRYMSHFPENRAVILKSSNLIKVIHGISAIEEPNVNISILYDCICSGYSGTVKQFWMRVLNECSYGNCIIYLELLIKKDARSTKKWYVDNVSTNRAPIENE